MLVVGHRFEATIEEVVYGGYGLVRHQGWVILIESPHGCIAGEKVLLAITKKQSNYYWAQVEARLTASPLRIAPVCPHFGVCGGCKLQHVSSNTQQALKKGWLVDQLERSLGRKYELPAIEMVEPNQHWNWRKRIFLHARVVPAPSAQQQHSFKKLSKVGDRTIPKLRWEIGYFSSNERFLVYPTTCPIFTDKAELLERVRNYIETISPRRGSSIEICIGKISEYEFGVVFHVTGNLGKDFVHAVEFLKPLFSSIAIKGRDTQIEYGPQLFTTSIEGLEISYSLSAFIQNHPEAYKLLLSSFLNDLEAKPPSLIWDLYSGVGVFSNILLNKGYRIESVEFNKQAVDCAKKSIRKNGLEENARLICGKVEDVSMSLSPDAACWIVNPPREGMAKEFRVIAAERLPKEVVYISCHLSTMIRDIEPLLAGGMKIERIRGFDFFPQTTHMEVICHLKR